MKKLLVLAMALVLVAFALPAFAQVQSNDINDNGAAAGNTQGYNNNNTNQFLNANAGDQYTGGGVNGGSVTVNDNFSRNTVDTSIGLLLNKSAVTVTGSFNETNVTANAATISITATDSLNGNTVYVGPMNLAWQYQYAYTHQFDHQMNFPTTFQDSTDAAIYMPINPVHLSQSNTGITAGVGAGACVGGALGGSGVAFNATGADISGMFLGGLNAGGVAHNQAAANVVTAFSAGF